MSFYIVTYYLPSGLFVMVSWISFLVSPDVIPGKIQRPVLKNIELRRSSKFELSWVI
jgi:hypothetical protein